MANGQEVMIYILFNDIILFSENLSMDITSQQSLSIKEHQNVIESTSTVNILTLNCLSAAAGYYECEDLCHCSTDLWNFPDFCKLSFVYLTSLLRMEYYYYYLSSLRTI